MCPLWPAHYVLLYLMVFGVLWIASFEVVGAAAKAAQKYDVVFEPNPLKGVIMDSTSELKVSLNKTGPETVAENDEVFVEIIFYSSDENIIRVSPERINVSSLENELESTPYYLNVTGEFIGRAEICAKGADSNASLVSSKCIDVSVIRKSRAIDKAFTYSVVALVAIIYINMGAALDLQAVKETMKRPIGPAIGFMSQFIIMPLLAYGIGKALIPDNSLRLGLFATGCSPGGGASNIWTLTLGGNLNLSITMTTISSFAAFVMMPLWILYFGKLVTSEEHLRIPNDKIATFAVSLVVPLIVGLLIRHKLPKVAAFLVRMLKPFAAFLIIFIVIFAIYTNYYIFKLFTWQICIAGMLLPWLGYLLGACSALLLRQNWKDSLAIGIETGVQNTGLSVFILRMSLGQPDSDITTVMPVAVSIMTPVIPVIIFIAQKIRTRNASKKPEGDEVRKDALLIGLEESSIDSVNSSSLGGCGCEAQVIYPS